MREQQVRSDGSVLDIESASEAFDEREVSPRSLHSHESHSHSDRSHMAGPASRHSHDHEIEHDRALVNDQRYIYSLSLHAHDSHFHFNLTRREAQAASMHEPLAALDDHVSGHSNSHGAPCSHSRSHSHSHGHSDGHAHSQPSMPVELQRDDEGCPCCVAAIDLDEVATAISEIGKHSGSGAHSFLGGLADFKSGAHWGIFLGISGPLSLVGLTAAVRNVKGTVVSRRKLDAVINGLEFDISAHKARVETARDTDREDLVNVVHRLEAFLQTLKYSKFDTNFNLVVPGIVNGAASSVVLSSAVFESFWALPVIALYAGCQTTRNGYDVLRNWNEILPQDIAQGAQLNLVAGTKKINQITDSKRKFYTANTIGFSVFALGAAITAIALTSIVSHGSMLPLGLVLLSAGAISTGITNNIWTAKFKPRNGDIGVDRKSLDLDGIAKEVGERREVKKVLKNYTDRHLEKKFLKRLGCSVLASFPFLDEKGASLAHRVNQLRIAESQSTDDDRVDLLERLVNIKRLLPTTQTQRETQALLKRISSFDEITQDERQRFELVNVDRTGAPCEQILRVCKDLGFDMIVIEKFIKNAILKSQDEHDRSIGSQEGYLRKLRDSELFEIDGQNIVFRADLLETHALRGVFMNSLEESLLLDYVEKLRYEQYGLNDFYWSLKGQAQTGETSVQSHITRAQDHVSHELGAGAITLPQMQVSNIVAQLDQTTTGAQSPLPLLGSVDDIESVHRKMTDERRDIEARSRSASITSRPGLEIRPELGRRLSQEGISYDGASCSV